MINHPYGWALYKKHSSSQIKPGDCGYFDVEGDWRSIIRLTEPDAVEAAGWTPIPTGEPVDEAHAQQLHLSDDDFLTWGPKESSYAHQVDVGVEAGAP